MSSGYAYHPIYLEHDLPSHLAEEHMPFFQEHGLAGHPESSKRLEGIMKRLEGSSLLAQLRRIEAPPVSMELLRRIHDPAYISLVDSIAESGGSMLDPCPDPATYVSARSYDAALMAAGGAVKAVEAVLGGHVGT